MPYVNDLRHVVDMDAIRAAGLKLGVDPLGGAAAPYWEPISSVYHVDITVVNPTIDPTFAFMTVDHDGRIRMDPSSSYAMAGLVGLKEQYRLAFANDADADRLTRAPGNNAPIGGLKVVAASGWFAARPSGTEPIYKIYAESFKDEKHLEAIVAEAQHIVDNALQASDPGRR